MVRHRCQARARRITVVVRPQTDFHNDHRASPTSRIWSAFCEPAEETGTLGRYLADQSVLGHFATGLREFTEQRPVIGEVWFRQPEPSGSSPLRQLFGCPIRWGAARDALVLDRRALEHLRPQQSNAPMHAFFRHCGDELITALHGAHCLLDDVRREIRTSLAAGPSMGAIARRLGTSTRSLHRHLQQHEVTFRDLVDRERFRATSLLLARRHLSISQIAVEFGFSETSALSRAFRRWTGRSPRSERARGGPLDRGRHHLEREAG
jgi:AraC-like DNA-binding protein